MKKIHTNESLEIHMRPVAQFIEVTIKRLNVIIRSTAITMNTESFRSLNCEPVPSHVGKQFGYTVFYNETFVNQQFVGLSPNCLRKQKKKLNKTVLHSFLC